MLKNALSNIENIYVFLEKSPCEAEGEEKARYPQELECLSKITSIIP